jgi:hypothetical protein
MLTKSEPFDSIVRNCRSTPALNILPVSYLHLQLIDTVFFHEHKIDNFEAKYMCAPSGCLLFVSSMLLGRGVRGLLLLLSVK